MASAGRGRAAKAAVAALGALVLVTAACGGGDSSDADPPTSRRADVTLELSTAEPPVSSAPVEWVVRIVNRGRAPVTLRCPSARVADVVLRQGGAEVYRWSDGRAFAQVRTDLTVEPGERLVPLAEPRLGVEPGTYEALAVLACEGAPPPAVITVEVSA